jgi:predicted nucleic acid-binding Zn ribbon protein
LGRTCVKCREILDESEFPGRRSRGGALSSWCRSCHNAASARWRGRMRVEAEGMQNYAHRRCLVCGAEFSTFVTAKVTCSEACWEEFAGAHRRAQVVAVTAAEPEPRKG